MPLRIRAKYDVRCVKHPRYSPEKEGRPSRDCEGCDSLWVMWTYSKVLDNRSRSEGVINTGRSSKQEDKEEGEGKTAA